MSRFITNKVDSYDLVTCMHQIQFIDDNLESARAHRCFSHVNFTGVLHMCNAHPLTSHFLPAKRCEIVECVKFTCVKV